MGNQVLKDHKVEKQPIACGGPGLAWKIYPARTKQTDEEVSIWVRVVSCINDFFRNI